jgi:hypothetical protein
MSYALSPGNEAGYRGDSRMGGRISVGRSPTGGRSELSQGMRHKRALMQRADGITTS